MRIWIKGILVGFWLVFGSCNDTEKPIKLNTLASLEVGDDNSYSNIYRVSTKHLHLDLDVNFENKSIYGIARHEIDNNHADTAIFDVQGLLVQKVTLGKKGNEKNTSYVIGSEDSIHGAPLSVLINSKTRFINIYYQTTEHSKNLHWKTEKKKHRTVSDTASIDSIPTTSILPSMMFTLPGEKYTRNWIPLQDVSYKKITYSAIVKVPNQFIPIMGTSNPTIKNDSSIYYFSSKKPISVHEIGLTVGEYTYKKLSKNIGLYLLSNSKKTYLKEMKVIPSILKNIEQFYGKSTLKTTDFVILPSHSPFHAYRFQSTFFIHPSVFSLYQHSSNELQKTILFNWPKPFYISNCKFNQDFAKGFNSYYQCRLTENKYGKEQGELATKLYINKCLIAKKEDFIPTYSIPNIYSPTCPPKQILKSKENAFKQLKGFLLFKTLEETLGKEKLDLFVKKYLTSESGHTLDDFEHELNHFLIQNEVIRFPLKSWIYGTKIPHFTYKISSKRHLQLHILVKTFVSNKKFLKQKKTIKTFKHFTENDWLTFISLLPKSTPLNKITLLDSKFQLSNHPNATIQTSWIKFGITINYKAVYTPLLERLKSGNDVSYLLPFYLILNEYPTGKAWLIDHYNELLNSYCKETRDELTKELGM
jgi:leukotriene-A4 hydrolase